MKLYTVTYIHDGIEKVEKVASSDMGKARIEVMLRNPGCRITGVLPIKGKKR
tara:strand:- start:7669 stop:7824 length:156 start_codon:yes stop_codon:yes gene_type:complete